MSNHGRLMVLGLGLVLGASACAQSPSDALPHASFEDVGRISWQGEAVRPGGSPVDAAVAALKAAGVAPVTGSGARLSDFGLVLLDQQVDDLGNTHLRLGQRVGGLSVEGGDVTVSMSEDRIHAVMGRVFPAADARVERPVSWAAAIETALVESALSREELSANPELSPMLVWRDGRLESQLRVDLATDLTRPRVYVDAVTGAVVSAWDRMEAAAAAQSQGSILGTDERGATSVPLETWKADDGYYYQRDTSRNRGSDTARTIRTYDVDQCGVGTTLCGSEARSVDNTWPKAHNNSAHFLAGQVLDFWATQYGLDSYDGRGANLRVYQMQSSNYDNAYWNGVDSIIIGDGSFSGSGGYYDYLSRADVMAHELSHAVEGAVGPDLLYKLESGALSEATADMTAALFERWYETLEYGTSTADWLIGEDAISDTSAYPYRAMRNMADPKEMGDPDTWRGQYWVSTEGCSPSSSNDNCGVHTNSGPANYAFVLQTEGGAGTNDHGLSYDVEPMGIDKAHAVMFQALRYHMTETAGYQEYYDALTASAVELYGAGSAEARCVEDSLHAVGLRMCGNGACEVGETEGSCAADCTGAVPTPEPTPAPVVESFSSYVADIALSQRAATRTTNDLYATVTVNASGDLGTDGPLPGAMVTLSVEDGRGNLHTMEAPTDNTGKVTVAEYKVRRGEVYEVCVLDVTSAEEPYDPSLNVETCASLRISR